jgi:hypothetical protein
VAGSGEHVRVGDGHGERGVGRVAEVKAVLGHLPEVAHHGASVRLVEGVRAQLLAVGVEKCAVHVGDDEP